MADFTLDLGNVLGPKGDQGEPGAQGERGPVPTAGQIRAAFEFDDEPTEGSSNPVTSGGVRDAIDKAVDRPNDHALEPLAESGRGSHVKCQRDGRTVTVHFLWSASYEGGEKFECGNGLATFVTLPEWARPDETVAVYFPVLTAHETDQVPSMGRIQADGTVNFYNGLYPLSGGLTAYNGQLSEIVGTATFVGREIEAEDVA